MNACGWFVVAWVTCMAAGCASAPIHYYTLTPPAAESAPISAVLLEVEVRVVHVPPQLNHSALMVRDGPAQMTLLENERWASPIKEEIAAALRLQLQRQPATLESGASYDKLLVQLDVRQFEAEFANRTWLEASYSATLSAMHAPAVTTRTVSCSFRTEQPIREGYAQIVAGYQRDVVTLAETIAAAVAGVQNGADDACRPS
jgi:uncharacterized lipoprotein YmbA